MHENASGHRKRQPLSTLVKLELEKGEVEKKNRTFHQSAKKFASNKTGYRLGAIGHGVRSSFGWKNSGSLFLGLVEDLGFGGGTLVVGREGLLVEALDGLLRVGQLLGSLGAGHDDGLERERTKN